MPGAMLAAFIEMLPVLQARQQLRDLRVIMLGANWGQLKPEQQRSVLRELEALANEAIAPDQKAESGPVHIRSAEDAMTFFRTGLAGR